MTALDASDRNQSPQQDNPHVKQDTAKQSLTLPRRHWLVGGLVTACALGVAESTRRLGFWHLADVGIGTVAHLKRSLEAERAQLAQAYREDSKVALDVPRVARVFLMCELMSFYRGNSVIQATSFEDFSAKHIDPFFERAKNQSSSAWAEVRRSGASTPDREQFGTDTIPRIVELKKALFDLMGKQPRYWACRNNIIDPILSGDLNCRSGSWLLALAARVCNGKCV